MNDRQSNKYLMLLKVQSFFENNSSVFSPLPHFPPLLLQLNTLSEGIMKTESKGNLDTSGYTEQKSMTRVGVEEISGTVSLALLSWGAVNAQPHIIERTDYLSGSLTSSTDSDLYVLARQLFAKADPVKALLTPYGSGPADVALLDTRAEEFLPQIRVASNNRKSRSRSVKQLEELFKQADELLETLDIHMMVYKYNNANLHLKYALARKIDKRAGGHTVHKKRGNVLPGYVAHAPFSAEVLKAGAKLLLTNGSKHGDLVFYFSNAANALPHSTTKLTKVSYGKPVNTTATEAGYSSQTPFLNVHNPNVRHCAWKAEVVKKGKKV